MADEAAVDVSQESEATRLDAVEKRVNIVARAQIAFRKAAIIVMIAFIGAFLVNGAVSQRINADARARDKHSQCENANSFKRYDKARWDYILKLAGPPRDAAAAQTRDKFEHYIIAADALKDC